MTKLLVIMSRLIPDGPIKRILKRFFYRYEHQFVRLGLYKIGYYKEHYEFNRGDIVIDLGARAGVTVVDLAESVGNDGLVIAIEPEKDNLRVLRRAVAGRENVIVVPKAVWSSKGTMRLNLHEFDDSHSLLEEMMEPGQTGKSAQVEVDTLDGILAELNVQKVDFIKMNIEGAEIEVLKGAVGTLKNNSVALAIEAHHLVGGAPTHETVVPWLKEAGFDAFLGRKGVVYARNAR